MRVSFFIEDPSVIEKILTHLCLREVDPRLPPPIMLKLSNGFVRITDEMQVLPTAMGIEVSISN
jgi:hypothetical protein